MASKHRNAPGGLCKIKNCWKWNKYKRIVILANLTHSLMSPIIVPRQYLELYSNAYLSSQVCKEYYMFYSNYIKIFCCLIFSAPACAGQGVCDQPGQQGGHRLPVTSPGQHPRPPGGTGGNWRGGATQKQHLVSHPSPSSLQKLITWELLNISNKKCLSFLKEKFEIKNVYILTKKINFKFFEKKNNIFQLKKKIQIKKIRNDSSIYIVFI